MSPDIGCNFARSRRHNGNRKRIQTEMRSRSRSGYDIVDIHHILSRLHAGLGDVVVRVEAVVLRAPEVM